MANISKADTWEALGQKNFDAAVSFFELFVEDVNKRTLQKWVKAYVVPSTHYISLSTLDDLDSAFYMFLSDNFSDTPLVKFFDAMYDFMNRFQVNEDGVWSYFADFTSEAYGWELDDLDEHVLFLDSETDEDFEAWYKTLPVEP